MILTVTPNPSLDLLFQADRLVWDDANRIDSPRRRAGGQGINVTRAARALGADSIAVALLGGRVGDELEHMLAREGTPYLRLSIEQETRVFAGVRETETGKSLLLNPRGPTIPEAAARAIVAELCTTVQSQRAAWVAGCGSIPPGLPKDLYARIGEAARAAGSKFVADCDGEALRAAAPFADLIVPNHHEACRLAGVEITDTQSMKQALAQLLALGPATVAITLGARGAALATRDEMVIAEPPPLQSGSAVGAGDAFLAALLFGLSTGQPLQTLACDAVAAGSSVLLSQGDQILSADDAARMREKTQVRPLM